MADIIDPDFGSGGDRQSLIAFNVPDLKALAAKILRRANEVAQQKIQAAQQTVAQMEKKAFDEAAAKGYADGVKRGESEGRAAGEKTAREEFQKNTGAVAGALQNALRDMAEKKVALQAEAEADLLRLAVEVARRIVRREVEVDARFVVPIVGEAIALTNNRSDLIVRVNPADEKVVKEELPGLRVLFNDLGRVELRADSGIEPGGAVVMSREGEVDMRLLQQFKALELALVGDTKGLELSQENSARDVAVDGALPKGAAVDGSGAAAEGIVEVVEPPVAAAPDVAMKQVVDAAPQMADPAMQAPDNADNRPVPAAENTPPAQPEGVFVEGFGGETSGGSGGGSSLAGLMSLGDIPLDSSAAALIEQTLREQGGGGSGGGAGA